MKKFFVILLIIPLFAHSAQNFNTAKIKLIQLYKLNFEQTTFYYGCEFSWAGKKDVVDFSKCGYEPRKNLNRAERIEWEHVMPAKLWASSAMLA